VTPAALIPFEQTRDKVLASWKAAQLKKLKTDRAEEIVAAVSAGASLADQGLLVSNATGLERSGFIEGAPTTLLATAFDTTPGTAAVVTQDDTVFVVVPLKVTEADPQAADTKQVHDVLSTRLEQSMAGDLADLYARASETEAGLTIDSTAINAVQAQMQ
jgi:peptidyl-prolyl cis-trans isomerase D